MFCKISRFFVSFFSFFPFQFDWFICFFIIIFSFFYLLFIICLFFNLFNILRYIPIDGFDRSNNGRLLFEPIYCHPFYSKNRRWRNWNPFRSTILTFCLLVVLFRPILQFLVNQVINRSVQQLFNYLILRRITSLQIFFLNLILQG
jgi:hypothetical protein